MSTESPKPQPDPQGPKIPTTGWAAPVTHLNAPDVPAEAVKLNVDGRQLTGVVNGFGQLWRKTYRVRLDGVNLTPAQVIATWKENFPSFWPKGNRFYGTMNGIRPGEVAVLNLAGPGGMNAPGGKPMISTGIMVIYVDDESFSFMTPQGHVIAGMITFSSYEEDGALYAQAQALVRPSDPFFELMFRMKLGHMMEDDFWQQTLKNLAAHFGVQAVPEVTNECVDPSVQWSQAGNIWHNSAIRTTLYTLTAPIRWVGRRLGRAKTKP